MNYEGPERRSGAVVTEDRVQLLIQEAVSKALAAHEQHLMAHMDRQFAALRNTFSEAFPGGDPHGHRIAHEKFIAQASWWDNVKANAFAKIAGAGIWALVLLMLVALWQHLKSEVKK